MSPHLAYSVTPSPHTVLQYGGGKRIRTDDPLLAKQVLYQLSYTPVVSPLLPFQGAFRYLENYIASSNKLRKLPSRHAT